MGRAALATFAVVCAVAAQALIDNDPRWPAVVAGVAGVIALMFAVRGVRIGSRSHDSGDPPRSLSPTSIPERPARLALTQIALTLVWIRRKSVELTGLSSEPRGVALTLLAIVSNPNVIRMGGLWTSAMLLTFSLVRFAGEPPWLGAWITYVAAVSVALLSLLAADGRLAKPLAGLLGNEPITFRPAALWPWLGLLGILVLAAALRLHRLGELPPGIWHDEFVLLTRGIEFISNLRAVPAWDPHTQTASWYALFIGWVTEIAGVSPNSGRLVSVCFGLAGVVAVFLLARAMLGMVPGLIAAFLMAVMRWDITWSRIGMHNIASPLFAALAAWLVIRGLRTGRPSDFGLAGAALGLAIWVYQASYLLPFVIGLIMLHALIFSIAARRGSRQLLVNGAVMAMTTALVAAPLIETALTDSEILFARAGQTSILGNVPLGEALQQIKFTTAKHLQMFHIEGDFNGRHNLPGAPMLDFVSGALLLLGTALAFTRWRDGALLVLPFWILVMVLPGILTLGHEAPQSLRSINVIPAVVILITLPLAALWQSSDELRRRLVRLGIRSAVIAALALIAFLNIDAYFVKYAQHPEVYAAFSTDSTLIAFDVRERLNHGNTIFATRDYAYNSVAGLLTSWPSPEVLAIPAGAPIATEKAPSGATVYISPREQGLFHVLSHYYPDSDVVPVTVPDSDRVLYYRAVITQEQLDRRHGLTAVYTSPAGERWETTLLDTDDLRLDETAGPDVASLEARGALHIREGGAYAFFLESERPADILLDGLTLIDGDKPMALVEPAIGVHSLQLRAEINGATPARLLWQPPGTAELQPIPLSSLYHDPVHPTGLVGRYFQNDVELPDGPVDFLASLPSLAHPDWYTPPVPEPYLVVWDGILDAPTSGEYGFRAREIFGDLCVEIDGMTVIESGALDGSIHLPAGSHAIRITYLSEQPPSRFRIWWQPPGAGEPEGIPIDVLKPLPEHMFRQPE